MLQVDQNVQLIPLANLLKIKDMYGDHHKTSNEKKKIVDLLSKGNA